MLPLWARSCSVTSETWFSIGNCSEDSLRSASRALQIFLFLGASEMCKRTAPEDLYSQLEVQKVTQESGVPKGRAQSLSDPVYLFVTCQLVSLVATC